MRDPVDGTCDLQAPIWADPVEGPPSHPALEAAQAALRGAGADVFAATAAGPTVSATGNAAWYATEAGSGPGWSAGAEARMPLVTGGRGLAGISRARAEKNIATLALEEQERALRVALRSNTARHEAARLAMTARRVALKAAQEALVLVEERYRTGTVDVTAWMDVRRSRDAAAVAFARAEAEVGTALAELEAARGVVGH
jgi:outer membrane protein TolC